MKPRTRITAQAGLGLVELMIVMSLFSVVALVSFMMLRDGIGHWRKVMGTEEASLELAKAGSRLSADLRIASFDQTRVRQMLGTGPHALPSGVRDGGVVWFLSATDESTGMQARNADGAPFWQRNILYYLAVPGNHQATFGYACSGGKGVDDLDDRCPHKVLIRKEIDRGSPTTPDLSSKSEKLMDSDTVKQYLTRPVGFDVSAMNGEPGVKDVRIVARTLLTFRPELVGGNEVVVHLQTVALKDVGKVVNIGTEPLSGSGFVNSRQIGVFPMN